ncbi:proline-rich receptor-like protein kinase PERK14 [Trachypithecus francoisi]|uniref:proline-rich receptor-like protein kinase PERK14 n=1 Tax=Trachypithecus francoisi TaxID=54180 RepID=UPI00141BB524|nr:proline-rich receptor-like protein kinase PERK14 [Trachypithecus francoisi]
MHLGNTGLPVTLSTLTPEGWGQVHSGGLFRGRFSPAPAGTSSWPLAGNTGRPPVPLPPPLRRPLRSRPGSVPGNSSISLLPPRLQETETQIPPLRRGPAETSAGADPHWVAGPKPSPTLPLRPAPPPAARPRRRWEPSECLRTEPRRAASVQQLSTTRASNGKAAGLTQVSGCNDWQCPGEGRNAAFPCGNLQKPASLDPAAHPDSPPAWAEQECGSWPERTVPPPRQTPPAPHQVLAGAVERGSPGGEGLHITVKWRCCSPHKDQEACQGSPGRTAVGVGRSAAPIGAGEESADPINPAPGRGRWAWPGSLPRPPGPTGLTGS